MTSRLQIRRDTQANWASANPTLQAGELGFETDTGLIKVGNGTSLYNALTYAEYDYFRLTANGSAVGPAISDFFPSGSYPIAAGAVYEAEWTLYFLKTTNGTATFTITSSVAPANLVAHYIGGPVAGIATAGAPITAGIVTSTATAAALPATTSLSTTTNQLFIVRATIEGGATNGTVKLQITESAGTVTPLRGSMFKIKRIPNANYGAFA